MQSAGAGPSENSGERRKPHFAPPCGATSGEVDWEAQEEPAGWYGEFLLLGPVQDSCAESPAG